MERDAFDEAVAGLVARERAETRKALALLVPAAMALWFVDPRMCWLAAGVCACVVLLHALTCYRVRAGLFGGNRTEALEILAYVSGRRG